MIKKYCFFDGGEVEFESSKPVSELIEYAFDEFGYYEPIGMHIVTIFQGYHSECSTGWFTVDTSVSCEKEIENPEDLFFAYHVPNVFYFAEGGWGHHMTSLGNHPQIDDPVNLHLKFDDFNHSVVINGKYSFEDVVKYLQRADYLPQNVKEVRVCAINPYSHPYVIPLTDKIMKASLIEFEKSLPQAVVFIEIC